MSPVGRRNARLAAVTVLALALASSACGDQAELTGSAARTLGDQVARVREAAGAGDAPQARRALRVLERTVVSLRDDGDIDRDRAARILTAVREVLVHLRLLPAASPSPTTSPSPSSVPPTDDEEGEGSEGDGGEDRGDGSQPGKDKDKGKGKDKGNGENRGKGKDQNRGNGNGRGDD